MTAHPVACTRNLKQVYLLMSRDPLKTRPRGTAINQPNPTVLMPTTLISFVYHFYFRIRSIRWSPSQKFLAGGNSFFFTLSDMRNKKNSPNGVQKVSEDKWFSLCCVYSST